MTKIEKIKYRRISVRESLFETKDLSELMIDLAYSAALFYGASATKDLNLGLDPRLIISSWWNLGSSFVIEEIR